MKILHVAHESVFTQMAYALFNSISSVKNDFVIVTDKSKTSFNIICKTITQKELLSRPFINALHDYDVIIIHQMHRYKVQLVNLAPKSAKIVWIGWSCDYYREGCIETPLLLPKTKRFFLKYMTIFDRILFLARKFRSLLARDRFHYRRAARRADIFCPVLPNEFKLVKNAIPGFNAKHIIWNYGESAKLSEKPLPITGNDILLGNSAAIENNHIEAMDILKGLKLEKQKVICPLSYGCTNNTDFIIEYGNNLLGDSFTPLTDFMQPNEYWRKLQSCRYVIMNHLVQKGMGNIIHTLRMGCSLFLQKTNPVYTYLKNNDIFFFDIDELKENTDLRHFNLLDTQILSNQKIINALYSSETYLSNTKRLIDSL